MSEYPERRLSWRRWYQQWMDTGIKKIASRNRAGRVECRGLAPYDSTTFHVKEAFFPLKDVKFLFMSGNSSLSLLSNLIHFPELRVVNVILYIIRSLLLLCHCTAFDPSTECIKVRNHTMDYLFTWSLSISSSRLQAPWEHGSQPFHLLIHALCFPLWLNRVVTHTVDELVSEYWV